MPTLEDVLREVTDGRRSQAAQDARDYRSTYLGDQERFLERNPDETPEEFRARPHMWLNLTGQITDELSGLYDRDPKREFVTDELTERIERIYDQSKIDLLMGSADAYTRLLGVSALQAYWDEFVQMVRVRLITRDNFEVWNLEGRPDRPEYVLVYGWQPGDEGAKQADLYRADRVWRLETDTNEQSRLQVVGVDDNPYGRLPFVFIHNSIVTDHFFTPGIAWSVCPQNWNVNKRLTELVQVQIKRSYPQRYVSGVDKNQTITEGLTRWLRFTPGADDMKPDVGQLSPDLALSEVFDTIQEEIKLILATNGVPENAFRLKVDASSGAQVRAEQEPLVRDRRQRTKVFKPAEHALVELVAMVNNTHASQLLPETADEMGFSITFYPEPESLPGAEKVVDEQHLLDAKVISRVDIRMDRFPDESREEAEASLAQVDADNEAAPSAMPAPLFGGGQVNDDDSGNFGDENGES